MPKRWKVDELQAPAGPVDPDALAAALAAELESSTAPENSVKD